MCQRILCLRFILPVCTYQLFSLILSDLNAVRVHACVAFDFYITRTRNGAYGMKVGLGARRYEPTRVLNTIFENNPFSFHSGLFVRFHLYALTNEHRNKWFPKGTYHPMNWCSVRDLPSEICHNLPSVYETRSWKTQNTPWFFNRARL